MAVFQLHMNSRAVVGDIMPLHEEFIRSRLIFVESARMTSILKLLGATEADLENIKTVSNNLHEDPTLHFRRSRNGRFCFDFEQMKMRRLEFQPFALSVEEDFVRHDSGKIREFEEVDEELQGNSVLQALFAFKALIFHGVPTKQRPNLNYDTENFICTLFNLRTVTNNGMLGEPALEGVHSDGVDITMTTYLGSDNMQYDSAVTFIHDNAETNALRWNETSARYHRGFYQHRNFLDTLLFADHERKHSLSPVHAVDPLRPAMRDMLIFFTRKPVVESHISHPYDSLNPHLSMPLEFSLF